jgi:arsenate reductase
MKRILFLCTKNSCRSQMAEGWARHLLGKRFEVVSAGSEPAAVDPRAIEVMAEVGIDLSAHRSKSVEAFKDAQIDHVFTLCGAAHDQCPLWPGGATVQHRDFDDPPELAKAEQTREAALQHYRRVRDEIGAWIKTLSEELVAHG